MEPKAGIRILVTLTLTAALIVYHLANAFAPTDGGPDLFTLYRICQWFVLLLAIFLFISSEFVAALILTATGKRFIGGQYSGDSYRGNNAYPLQATVRQSMFDIRIEAQSKRPNGEVVSNWFGTRFKEDAQTSYFGIELRPILHPPETGVLDVAYNNGSLQGSYRPARPDSTQAYRIELTRDEPNSLPWKIIRRTPLYALFLGRHG